MKYREKLLAMKFAAPEVDDATAARVELAYVSTGDHGRDMIAAVRSELGPTLGLVEVREPTAVECELIAQMMIGLFNKLGTKQPIEPAETVAKVIFPAVRAVILNKDKPQ